MVGYNCTVAYMHGFHRDHHTITYTSPKSFSEFLFPKTVDPLNHGLWRRAQDQGRWKHLVETAIRSSLGHARADDDENCRSQIYLQGRQ